MKLLFSKINLLFCIALLILIAYVDAAIRQHADGSISSNSGPTAFLDQITSSQNRYQSDLNQIWSPTRSKREYSRLATAYAFAQSDIQLLVDEHNRLRRLVAATDMQVVGWDDNLALSAQAHANQCMFAHSNNRRNTGENIYASPFSNYRGAVKMWFDEVYDKNCGCTNFYKHCCGHYTQVAWASTSRIGCGYAKCNNILYLNGHHYILVCHYNPAGNVVYFSNGEMLGRPGFTYKQAGEAACSKCIEGYKCDDGLCVWTK